MTRISKISRLPRNIRHTLNLRLLDGEPGQTLVDWLNSLDETNKLLATAFKGFPISEQNISDWRQTGFLDWLRNQETRERIDRFLDTSDRLQSPVHDHLIPERLYSLLAAELASQTAQILAETTDPKERFRCIGEAVRSLKLLHSANTIAARELRERHVWEKTNDPDMAGMRFQDRRALSGLYSPPDET